MKYIIAGLDEQSSIDFKKTLDLNQRFTTLQTAENSIRKELYLHNNKGRGD